MTVSENIGNMLIEVNETSQHITISNSFSMAEKEPKVSFHINNWKAIRDTIEKIIEIIEPDTPQL